MNRLRLLIQTTALTGLLAIGAMAPAQTQGYAQKTRVIRAAVLLLDSDAPSVGAPGQTGAPFAFYNLDKAEGIKPTGWTFVNPSAPGAVTEEIRARYTDPPALPSTSLGMNNADVPPLGTVIDKRAGAYWTMRLSQLSDQQISDYDILLVAPRLRFSLNAFERERLRRFVDGGGTLWFDMSGPTAFDSGSVPFAVLPGPDTVQGNGYADSTSPLINGLRRLSGGDLYQINRSRLRTIGSSNADALSLSEFGRYRSVVLDPANTRMVISDARLGDGHIVVTARGAAQLLNQASALNTYGGVTDSNLRFYAQNPPTLNPQGRAAARLAVNIVGLSGGYAQAGGGGRKLGSAGQDPGSPVLSRFNAEANQAYGPGGIIESGVPIGAPVTYKGFLIATIHDVANDNYRVVVFDATPGRDADGDGDEDDGIVNASGAVQNGWRDSSVGKALDVVWVSRPIDEPLSSPVCAEVPEAPRINVDQILVNDSVGKLHVFQLNQRVGDTVYGAYIGGEHNEVAIVNPPGSLDSVGGSLTVSVQDKAVNPPTVYDGLAYVADTVPVSSSYGGRIWTVDLSTGARVTVGSAANSNGYWLVGGDAAGVPLPAFTASPTIGYIPIQDNTGGLDRVLYAPGVVNPGNTTQQPAFASIWLGAKGEKPRVEASGTQLKVITRAGTNGQLPIFFPNTSQSSVLQQMGIRLSITDLNGNPLTLSSWINTAVPPSAGAPGEIIFSSSRNQADFDTVNVRVDYSIDWSFDPKNLSSQIQRGRILLPVRKIPAFDTTQRIHGPIALTSRGTLHMIEGPVEDPTATAPSTAPGGTYWAMREDAGRGSFRVISRFTLYKNYNQTFGASGQQYPVKQVLEDVDGVQNNFPPFLTAPSNNFNVFSNFRFSGGIALRNGVAYASINADRGSGIKVPMAMIAAFRAEPETPEIRLGSGLGVNPRLVQADFQRSDPNALVRTPVSSTLAANSLTVDSENGIIRVENLATVNREEITDCISLSQPVGVGSDGRAFTLRYPEANGDRWSPLLWYGLWNGGSARNAPLVAGNEVFVAADTFLFGVLGLTSGTQTTIGGLPTNGAVWSVDADLPTTGNYAVPVPGRPWLIQQAQLVNVTPTSADASPYYRMPQNRGVRDFNDWKLRLLQTKMGTSTDAHGVAGGDGTVVAWGDRGLYGLSRADFIVCDEGRLLRIDSSGNPIANAFGSRFSGIGGGGGTVEMRPLVRPVKAYPVGTGEYLVVDAGANRIIRLDEDGTELRSIDRMTLDPENKPDAFRLNEPLTFKDPRDATTYEGYVYKTGASEVVKNQGAIEYWVRYIVADSGNGRIVELADRYSCDSTGRIGSPVTISQVDPESGATLNVPQVGVLIWQSPSLDNSAKVGDYYNSISRVFIGDIGTGRYVYVAGVGKARPTRSSAGLDSPNSAQLPANASGGAIVVFDPLGGTRVFDHFLMPDLRNTAFYNSATSTFDINTAASRPPQDNRPFTGLTAVTAQTYVSNGVASIRVMATDVDAVYEFAINSAVIADGDKDPTKDPVSGVTLAPIWMINEAAFTNLRGGGANSNALSFRPAYARRLDSGDVMIVNGYRGLTRDKSSTYSGEVALLDGLFDYGSTKPNLGFSLSSLRFELPPLTGIRGILSPVFADRR